MEHLNFLYFLLTFLTGIVLLSLSVFVYLKTKKTLIQYYLYLYSAFTLLVVTYTFSSYIQSNKEDSLIRTFSLLYCGVSIIFTYHLLKHYLRQHSVSADNIPDDALMNELDEEIFNKYNISPREQDVIHLILQGYRNQKIADELSVTVSTVKKHITKIYYKLEVKSRYELIAFFKNPAGDQTVRTNDHNDS